MSAHRTSRAGARVRDGARATLGLAAASLLVVAVAWAQGSNPTPATPAAPATAATARRPSVKDSPGYRPAHDPESLAVVLGRRTGSPLVRQRFHGGARSLDELGRRVCRALHHQQRDSLLALCVADSEFRDILWREFPQSRPATGLEWQDGWRILGARLRGGCGIALRDHGGRFLEYVRFEAIAPATRYRNFALHDRVTLIARNELGQLERLDWIRSIAERKGAFKIYSVKD